MIMLMNIMIINEWCDVNEYDDSEDILHDGDAAAADDGGDDD